MVGRSARAEPLTVTISRAGRVTLPKTLCRQRGWAAGTRLIVEDIEEGVLLRAAPLFAPTRVDEVFGCLAFGGRAKTIGEMDAAVAAAARARSKVGEV